MKLHSYQDEKACLDPFIAVIVYEDSKALERTLPIFQRLIQEFASETEFKCIWVGFENLTTDCVRKDAARNAVKADMVIFSSQTRELPQHVCDWVENWLPGKNLNHSALVALTGTSDPQPDTTPAHRYLENVAARAAMNFLSEVKGSANVQTPGTSSIPDQHRAIIPNHWGINE